MKKGGEIPWFEEKGKIVKQKGVDKNVGEICCLKYPFNSNYHHYPQLIVT